MKYLVLFFAAIHPAYTLFVPAFLFAVAVGGVLIDSKRRRIHAKLTSIRVHDERARRGFPHKE